MRKLASVQKILELNPIPNADKIEVCKVLGWRCVVQKGEFKVGDLVVYCEVDSVFPTDYKLRNGSNPFQFLIDKGIKRIRTIQLRGQVSQGIVFPISILDCDKFFGSTYYEGYDVTDVLGIVKYEPPIPACLDGKMKGVVPSCIPKTDEIRVQILQELIDKYKGTKCYVSVKMDGTSATYYFNDNEFGVCGRSICYLDSEENTYWQMARQYNLEHILRDVQGHYAIQGEICGEGIQGNKYKIKGHQLFVFNVFDIDNYRYLNYDEFIKFNKYYNLQTVPILMSEYILDNDIDKLIELSKGDSILFPVKREGIVIRALEEVNEIGFGRLSLKVINPDFLIQHGE